jgi:hypothetical protein
MIGPATPDAALTFGAWTSLAEPLMTTSPTASETFCACIDAPAPVIGALPVEPEADETLRACVLAAEPLIDADPLAALAFFCCVDELEPEASADPEADDVLAA